MLFIPCCSNDLKKEVALFLSGAPHCRQHYCPFGKLIVSIIQNTRLSYHRALCATIAEGLWVASTISCLYAEAIRYLGITATASKSGSALKQESCFQCFQYKLEAKNQECGETCLQKLLQGYKRLLNKGKPDLQMGYLRLLCLSLSEYDSSTQL